MEILFGGKPSQNQIRALLNPVMDLYGLSKTDDNYNRCGSTPVRLDGAHVGGGDGNSSLHEDHGQARVKPEIPEPAGPMRGSDSPKAAFSNQDTTHFLMRHRGRR